MLSAQNTVMMTANTPGSLCADHSVSSKVQELPESVFGHIHANTLAPQCVSFSISTELSRPWRGSKPGIDYYSECLAALRSNQPSKTLYLLHQSPMAGSTLASDGRCLPHSLHRPEASTPLATLVQSRTASLGLISR